MSDLGKLPELVAAELRGKAAFAPVGVLNERSKEITFAVEKTVNQFKGLALVVLPATGKSAAPGASNPSLALSLRVSVAEHVLINQSDSGTRVPALEAVQAAIQILHGWTPPGFNGPMRFDEFASEPDDKLLIYLVHFEVPLVLKSLADPRRPR